ncbi:MAG: hypothetical protein KJ905_02495 [Nanoarchaeota archaeon]|nr:hypothetical protein [Nanoarchaeota archaeon]MBU1501620.1 hypothetical protein [Nanoarchaeota archaeon]
MNKRLFALIFGILFSLTFVFSLSLVSASKDFEINSSAGELEKGRNGTSGYVGSGAIGLKRNI